MKRKKNPSTQPQPSQPLKQERPFIFSIMQNITKNYIKVQTHLTEMPSYQLNSSKLNQSKAYVNLTNKN